jgi:hypothetical protein
MKITKKSLHERFTASEEALGVYYGDYATGETEEDFSGDPDTFEESALLPTRLPMSICTNSATYICGVLGHGDIFGFSAEQNPAFAERVKIPNGHDFAVIHSRYIVDPWISLYTGNSEQGTFDLRDPKDAEIIRGIYGEPSNWSLRMFNTSEYPEDWQKGSPVYKPQSDADFPANKKVFIGPNKTRQPSDPSFSL